MLKEVGTFRALEIFEQNELEVEREFSTAEGRKLQRKKNEIRLCTFVHHFEGNKVTRKG